MLQLGRFNTLRILESRPGGLLLDGGQSRVVELPADQVRGNWRPGEQLEVFVYVDSAGQLAASVDRPLVEMDQVAWLEVIDVNNSGAFVDWGLPKDLFIPFAEQLQPLRKGQHTLVRVYLDNQNRIAGSTRLDHWLGDEADGLRTGQQVSLIVGEKTELGFKAVINHSTWGLLYANELYRPIRKGMTLTGYIKRVRPDNKVDLTLEKPGFDRDRTASVGDQIIAELTAHAGFLPLTDKSPPADIHATFGVSKKVFKQALGALYKQRRVSLEAGGIRLVES